MPANSLVYSSPSNHDALEFAKRNRLRVILGDGIPKGYFDYRYSREVVLFFGGSVFGLSLMSIITWLVDSLL